MFNALGLLVTRFPWICIGLWVGLGLALHFTAPPWESLVSQGELEHLPADSPSREANRIYDKAFPNERAESNIVIVLRRADQELEVADYLFMAQQVVPALLRDAEQFGGVVEPSILQQLEATLLADGKISEDEIEDLSQEKQPEAKQSIDENIPQIVSITAPHNSVLGPLLVSDDGQAMLILIDLTSSFLNSDNQPIINQIESTLESLTISEEKPPELELSITGSAILGRDVVAAVTESTDAVENWTIWLVLLLLFFVFRAPGAALIPLVTLFVAVNISMDVLAALAAGGVIQLYDGLQIYVTVLIYGAGVDYSMFLISRFREELSHGEKVRRGLTIALVKIGFAIVISAGTEVVGLGTLAFAQFGKFSQAGTSVPIGLTITLLASLTLTVALLQVAGRWGFWPQRLAFRGAKTNVTRDRSDEEIDRGFTYRFWERVGQHVCARPVVVLLLALLLMLPFCIVAVINDDNLTYDLTSGLPDESPSLRGNAMLQEHFSRGIIGPITILLVSEDLDFTSAEGIRKLTQVSSGLLENDGPFKIADLRELIHPVGVSPRADRFIELLEKSIPGRWERMQGKLAAEIPADADEQRIMEELEKLIIKEATNYYVSQAEPYANRVTRMSLILENDPFSRESINTIDAIGRQIQSAAGSDSKLKYEILGPTAGLYDVRTTAERDRAFMRTYVTLAVFLILVVLLRRIIVPVWLMLTVILTYLTTMGVTYLIFQFWEGEAFAGLQWTVPVLLFTLLMAVGADYNVLLVQRFEEEQSNRGTSEGVVHSLAATGGLISGAGVVMAGTFLALNIGGTMSGMHQLGFALAFGVLLDTFLIRPLMVPSFLLLLERWKKRLSK